MAANYIYTYGYNDDEGALALMEMRAFFGYTATNKVVVSTVSIDPSRSVFIREKMHVLIEAESEHQLMEQAHTCGHVDESYKVVFMKHDRLKEHSGYGNSERLQLTRTIGNEMPGPLDLKHPDQIYAVTVVEGRFYLGHYEKSEPVWMKHVNKPQGYSTALNARTARTLVNILNPHAKPLKLMDPCCGIGTLLVEAASMGIPMSGRDKNPLACVGARENLAYYNYPLQMDVQVGLIQDVEDFYDAVVVDLPYNLYTHSSYDQQMDLIHHAARIADRVVIVTIEPMDEAIQAAGLRIVDRAETIKQRFKREILLCEKS